MAEGAALACQRFGICTPLSSTRHKPQQQGKDVEGRMGNTSPDENWEASLAQQKQFSPFQELASSSSFSPTQAMGKEERKPSLGEKGIPYGIYNSETSSTLLQQTGCS